MRRNITVKLGIILFLVALFLYLLYPTIKFNYLLSPEAKEDLKIEDPKAYDKLLENSIKLGLDLQGGMHVVMEVDIEELTKVLARNKDERFDEAWEESRLITAEEDRDFLTVFAQKLEEKGADIARYFGTKSLKEHDEILSYLRKQASEAIDRSLEVLRNRVDQFGVSEPTIQKQGNKRIIIELAGITDPQRVRGILGQTALLEFRMLKDQQITQNVASKINEFIKGEISDTDILETEEPKDTSVVRPEDLFGKAEETVVDTTEKDSLALERDKLFKENLFFAYPGDPQRLLVPEENEIRLKLILEDPGIQNIIQTEGGDAEFVWGKLDPGGEYFGIFLVDKEPELTGETITDAFPQPGSGYDPGSFGKFEVSLTLNDEGARIFSRVTGANLNKRLAIILDRKVHSAPTIQAKIRDGRARITGLETMEEAQDLSVVLKAGALPAPVRLLEERTVGPSLGKDSVRKGTNSAFLGLLLVAIFMIIYYKFSGFIADIALILNIIILMGVMSYFHATLTLPGIAGIILTIGMAVDANVLIFERIREEMDKGKTVWASIETGYRRALITILDANITTLIAGIVLYNFGSGPVKGFALTLIIGIAASMFTAIFVTRTIFEFLLERKILKKLSI
ncbi:MAG: protein translocase subunit SecD [Calditrichae bacterium]|nr:protein translocase subunit SecD [Calditrichia bacterium]